MSWPRNVFVNVNFPDVIASSVTGVEITRQGRRKPGDLAEEGNDPRGLLYVWIGARREEDPSRSGSQPSVVAIFLPFIF